MLDACTEVPDIALSHEVARYAVDAVEHTGGMYGRSGVLTLTLLSFMLSKPEIPAAARASSKAADAFEDAFGPALAKACSKA
jgi:hypothetical protein